MSPQPPLSEQWWHSSFQRVSKRGDPTAQFAPPKWSPEESDEFRGPPDRRKTDDSPVALRKQWKDRENKEREVAHFSYQGQTERHQGLVVAVEDRKARFPQHGGPVRVQVH